MKNSYLTVTDQFCGAGGSSQGIRNLSRKQGGGVEVKLALNHWRLAIQTHNTNFPETTHDCVDIAAVDPRRYASTDILITSPECTNHSLAKGGLKKTPQMNMFLDETQEAERSRATMWDVPRFAEYHKYNIIIVENVVDAKRWVMYPAWIKSMELLGYNYKEVFANSMFFFPTPQSRDRMYVVFWKKGNPVPDLDYRPLAHCPVCHSDIKAIQRWKSADKMSGRYKFQYIYICPVHHVEVKPYYYAAFNCIDWSNLGTRIGDRKKPLAANTVRRIEYGLDKFGKQGIPIVINFQHQTGTDYRVRSVFDKLPTVPTEPHLSLVTPFIILGEHSKSEPMVRDSLEPLQTQATRQTMGLVVPPFIVANYTPGYTRSTLNQFGTVTTDDHHGLVNLPFIIEMFKTSNARSILDPMGSQMTVPHYGLVNNEAFHSFISYYYGSGDQVSGIHEAFDTATSRDRYGLVSYSEPKIEDCYYRMLVPDEVKLAMAFDKDYIVLGNANQQVRQLGNAVTPPVMEWISEQCIKTLN